MSKIAFLGIGQMGMPMATRLIQAGHKLTVWNRSPGPAASMVEKGANAAESPAEAVSGAEFVITMLATPEALEQVVFGSQGIAQGLRSGQTFIDMSTVGPHAVYSVAERLPAGVAFVDSPVRGSVPQATQGKLQVYAGASDADFIRVRPILEQFGDVQHTGGMGTGAATKLVVNLTLGAAIATLGESLALGETLNLPRDMLLDVLAKSPIGGIVQAKRANIEARDFSPNFKLSLAEKDLRLVGEAAAMKGLDLRIARATRSWLEDAEARGAADLDFSAVVATITGEDGDGRGAEPNLIEHVHSGNQR